MSGENPPDRICGACSLCCTVLRVGELAKLGGVACEHQCEGGGCAIHQRRPQICRAYRCLWHSGGLGDDDRPDKLGAIVDILTQGAETRLSIQEARPEAFDTSARLQEIAGEYRESMPVRIVEAGNFLDPDRPFRVLLAQDVEHRVEGEWITVTSPGESPVRRRLSLPARMARRATIWLRRRKIARMHEPDRNVK
ncbi:MAG: hypothetical protein JRG94_16130 [Deltaproteobacteria bacterium]|nr:hypothetical protein [Deltaproteobacteria bacterium]MBW2724128.1 hypothetical protein [Deltaproteobacteria bacterium]